MPIVLHQFPAAGGVANPGYLEACELARQCADQYSLAVMPGPGGGIATGSCWAAVAVQPNGAAGFPAAHAVNAGAAPGVGGAALTYGVVFGHSQMAAIGAAVPVPGAPPAFAPHAERNALLAVAANGLALHMLPLPGAHAVMFVQLSPCGAGPGGINCLGWLNGAAAGGIANPFAAAIGTPAPGGLTLHVWYRWNHPAQVGAMVAWNGLTRANKLADINANW